MRDPAQIQEAERLLRQYIPKGMTAYLFGIPVAELSREGLIGGLGYLLREKEKQQETNNENAMESLKSFNKVAKEQIDNVRPFRRR